MTNTGTPGSGEKIAQGTFFTYMNLRRFERNFFLAENLNFQTISLHFDKFSEADLADTGKEPNELSEFSRDSEVQFVRVEVIAHYFGVTVRRVQQLTQEGIVKSTKVEGIPGRVYDFEETLKSYIRYLSDKANGKSQGAKMLELQEQKLRAEVALKDSQAELHQMKREIAAGKYIEREEVELDYRRFFLVFKRFATSIPPRLVSMVSDQISPAEARRAEHDLGEEVKRMLEAFVVAGCTPKTARKRRKKKDGDANGAAEAAEN